MKVWIKPFELFEVNGSWFLLKLKSLMHLPVKTEDVRTLSALLECYETDADEDTVSVLRRYRLLADKKWEPTEELRKLRSLCGGKRDPSKAKLVELFVSQTCNMGCTYCYGSDGTYHQQGLMDLETAKRAVEKLKAGTTDTDDVNIVFFGGEPLVNYALIKEIICFTEELFGPGRVTYGAATNMTLMTDAYLDFFASLPKFFLLVSIDGPKEIHNRQRPLKDGRDSHAVTAERISAALKRGISCTGRATVFADTDRTAVAEEMRRLGLSVWQLTPVSGCAADGVKRDDSERIHRMLLDTLPNEAVRFAEAVKRRDRETADALFLEEDLHNLVIEGVSGGEIKKSPLGCPAGRNQYAVSAEGDLYPCHRFVGMEDFRFGHVSDATLTCEVGEFSKSRFDCNPDCAECFLRYGCGGECYYLCFSDGPKGSIHAAPPYFCDYMRMRVKLKIYLCHTLNEEDKQWYFTRKFERPV